MTTIIYVSPLSTRHLYNAHPVYGLFYSNPSFPVSQHPLVLDNFSNKVPILFSDKKRPRRPCIYASVHPSPPDGALVANFQHSDTPRPLPEELIDFLSTNDVSLAVQPSPVENSVPVGFGHLAEEIYGPGFNPYPGVLEVYSQFLVPYSDQVVKRLRQPVSSIIPTNCDFGWSYVAPPEDFGAIYVHFPQDPSPVEFVKFVHDLYPDTPSYAEQIARIAVAISEIATATGEVKQRYIGAGCLLIGKRLVKFPIAFSTDSVAVDWEDLHKIAASRQVRAIDNPMPSVLDVERIVFAEFYFDRSLTVSRNSNPKRILAYVMMNLGGVWDYCILEIPSYMLPLLGQCTHVKMQRLATNTAAAKKGGIENWQIETSAGGDFVGAEQVGQIQSLLLAVDARSTPRPYTKFKE